MNDLTPAQIVEIQKLGSVEEWCRRQNPPLEPTDVVAMSCNMTGRDSDTEIWDGAREFLYDVMTTAAEGGIGYWAVTIPQRDAELNVTELLVADAEDEPDERVWRTITPEKLHAAILKIQRAEVQILKDIVGQFHGYPHDIDITDHDADGADVAVQIAAFGKVVYG